MQEITVIGAGPIGSYFAQQKECLVLEQKNKIGEPIRCTGLVSRNIDTLVPLKEHIIEREIHGAIIHTPNNEVTINKKDVAYVIDRKEFDNYLYEKAKSVSEFSLGEKVLGYEKAGNNFKVKTNKRIFETKHLIDASGPSNKSPYIIGMQARVKLKRENHVELFFGKNVCPDFFAWIVPETDEICRIGLATHNPKEYFKKFHKQLGEPEIVDYQGGMIPITKPKLIENGVYLLGDRAGQIKATTGGGIVTGLKSAKLLSQGFSDYEERFSQELEKELYLHYKIRSFLNKMDDKEIDNLIEISKKFKKELEEHGDMDFPSLFLTKLLNTETITFLLKNFGKLF